MDKNSNWIYIKGVPADVPGLPNTVGDSLEICTVDLPAFTHTIKQVKITRTPHKRFTMADIGRLETRIKNVEYYRPKEIEQVFGIKTSTLSKLLKFQNVKHSNVLKCASFFT